MYLLKSIRWLNEKVVLIIIHHEVSKTNVFTGLTTRIHQNKTPSSTRNTLQNEYRDGS